MLNPNWNERSTWEQKQKKKKNRELLYTKIGLYIRNKIGTDRGEPLYKGRALPFIEQGEGRVIMWDKSHDTSDSLSRGYCCSAP